MTTDSEQAWDEFVEKRSFEKSTSIQGQLDAITSMLSDIKTDTERAAAASAMQPDIPMGAPMDMPMDMPIDEEASSEPAPEDMDMGAEETVAPADMSDGMQGVPSEMPPEAPEDFEEPPVADEAPVDAGAEMPATEIEPMGESGAVEFEEDMISQIKTMINTTNDPEQLKGLSKLLSTALSQSRPAVPMQGSGAAEEEFAVSPMAKANLGVTTNDGEEVMREAISGAVDSTLGVGFSRSSKKANEDEPEVEVETEESVEEEPIPDAPEMAEEAPADAPMDAPADDVDAKIDEVADKVAEEVAEVVEEAITEGVEEKSDDAPAEETEEKVEVEEKTEDKEEDKSENEEKNDEISEDTESFEAKSEEEDDKPVMKSAAEMFAERRLYGIDGMPSIVKTAPEEIQVPSDTPAEDDKLPEDVPDTLEAGDSEGADIIDQMNAASIGKSLPSARDMFNGVSAFQKYDEEAHKAEVHAKLEEEDEEAEKEKKKVDDLFGNAERGGDVKAWTEDKKSATTQTNLDGVIAPEGANIDLPPAQGAPVKTTQTTLEGNVADKPGAFKYSASDAGIHIRSFSDMYAERGGFVKTVTEPAVVRPPVKAAVGGETGRPDLANIHKSADNRKPLQIGVGVDAHEQVAEDWERYFALKESGQL